MWCSLQFIIFILVVFSTSNVLAVLPFAVFIYSMPGYKCSIRERMLYSSCKNNLIDMVENKLQLEIEKKVRDEKIVADFCAFDLELDVNSKLSNCFFS